MTPETATKAQAEAINQATQALTESWPDIARACDAAAIEAAEQGKDTFKYRIGVTVTLEPRGPTCVVSTALAYKVAHKRIVEPVEV